MPQIAPGIIQTRFDFVGEILGPGAALYRDGLARWKHYHSQIDARLAPWQNRINAITGTEDEIKTQAIAIYTEMEQERERLYKAIPVPANPHDDPRISNDDRLLYHSLENMVLGKAVKDLPNIAKLSVTLQDWSDQLAIEAEDEIADEIRKKEERDRIAARRQRRRDHRAKNWSYVVTGVSTVLSVIPTYVTQIIGAVVAVAGSVGKAVYDADTARRYTNAIRNNANWLIYQYPSTETKLDQSLWNLDYLTGVEDLAIALEDGARIRMDINDTKIDLGIYDEQAILNYRMKLKWMKTLTYVGIGMAALVVLWKTMVR
jgi:hypothetical protein